LHRRRPERCWLATVVAALALVAGGLLELGTVVLALAGVFGQPPRAAWYVAVPVTLLLLTVVGLATLTALGGVIALRRHWLEQLGRPYAPHRRREWRPGFVVRAALRSVRTAASIFSDTPGVQLLLPYDFVEVRSLEEIRRTLDPNGTLDGLPFMSEMAAFCGRRVPVFRRVEKIHDYVTRTGLRRLRDTVLLEGLRCDGRHHGGCQASCHILWKQAWLKPVSDDGEPSGEDGEPRAMAVSERALPNQGREQPVDRVEGDGESKYLCQMTEVARASTAMAWKDPRHYLRDLLLTNVRPGLFVSGVSIRTFNRVQRCFKPAMVYPHLENTGLETSPSLVLGLQPGELVRVRPKLDIEKTLTAGFLNRGLWFDGEMLRFCGGEYRVSECVQRLIEEKSGRLITLSTPAVILEGVTATGEYLAFCPQNESILWREIWLERVSRRQQAGVQAVPQ
jgi:hypothetical protein